MFKASLDHTVRPYFKKGQGGEIARWLRAMTSLPQDPGSIRSTQMAASKSL